MRLIKNAGQLEYAPRACTVTGRIDGDFVDFQKHLETLQGPHRLYLKREIVEQAARLCGMVPGGEVDRLRAQMDALNAGFEELRGIVEKSEALEAALSETLHTPAFVGPQKNGISEEYENGEGI